MTNNKAICLHHLIKVRLAKTGINHSDLRISCLAYLIDFAYFYHNFASLSGGKYLKPASFVLDVIIYIPLTERYREPTKDEISLIDKVIQKWNNYSDKELKDFVKNTLPYKLSFEGEVIPYSLITQETENNLY